VATPAAGAAEWPLYLIVRRADVYHEQNADSSIATSGEVYFSFTTTSGDGSENCHPSSRWCGKRLLL
jgi:hypothetical protein